MKIALLIVILFAMSGCNTTPECNPCQKYVKGQGCLWISDAYTDERGVHCIEPLRCGGNPCPTTEE